MTFLWEFKRCRDAGEDARSSMREATTEAGVLIIESVLNIRESDKYTSYEVACDIFCRSTK